MLNWIKLHITEIISWVISWIFVAIIIYIWKKTQNITMRFLNKIIKWILNYLNKLQYRIIKKKDKYYYVEMLESLDIPFHNINELRKNWNKYILNKGHIEKVNYELYKYIKREYCKLLNKKDIICVDLIPKKEFSLWWSAFLYKMPRKQCKSWYLPVIFWDWHTYIYNFEYKKYKNNFTKVLDKDLLK